MPTAKRAELKAAYSIPELAELSGLSRWKVARLLQSNGVELGSNGSDRVVYLSALKRAMPELWDSILERLGAGA